MEGHLEFTTVNLFPQIFVEKEEDIAIGNEVLLKTYKHCIIANSVKAWLIHHGEVLVFKAAVARVPKSSPIKDQLAITDNCHIYSDSYQ